MKIFILMPIIALLLGSCMATFNNYQNNRTEFKHTSCAEIYSELDYANQFEHEIHANDKFLWKYLFVFPAMFETYHIIKNEKYVSQRKVELNLAAKAQNCNSGNNVNMMDNIQFTKPQIEPTPSAYPVRTPEDDRLFKVLEEERFYKKFEKQMLQY